MIDGRPLVPGETPEVVGFALSLPPAGVRWSVQVETCGWFDGRPFRFGRVALQPSAPGRPVPIQEGGISSLGAPDYLRVCVSGQKAGFVTKGDGLYPSRGGHREQKGPL